MEGKKIKVITKILAILVICLVSFVGVYTQNLNTMKNQVKEYELTKDLKGYRELVFEVSNATRVKDSEGKVVGNTDTISASSIETNSYVNTDEKINPEENLTMENYKISKSIIESRLKSLGVNDYTISMDSESGKIYLQIPEDNETDHIISNIIEVSKFEIKDSKDESTVFLSNKDIEKATAQYKTEQDGTTVFLEIKFNKEGAETLKEISTGEYAKKEEDSEKSEDEDGVQAEVEAKTEEGDEEEKTEEQENENSETSEEEEASKEDNQKEITLAIDDNNMITTSFDVPMDQGALDLSMGAATTDIEKINESLKSASTIATLLNSGRMPLTYKIAQNHYINSDISEELIIKAVYVVVAIIIVAVIVLAIKLKLKGIIAGISYIGFIALYLLTLRYANVLISVESLIGIVIIFAINYIQTYKLTTIDEKDEEVKKKAYIDEIKSSIIKILPIFIISVIFTFIFWTKISTLGMCIFWGILLSQVYNFFITRKMLD